MPEPRRLSELPQIPRSLDLEILVGNPSSSGGMVGRQTVRELLSDIEARLAAVEGASGPGGEAEGPGGAVDDTGLTLSDARAGLIDNTVDFEEGRDTTDAIEGKAPSVARVGLMTDRLDRLIAENRPESLSVHGTRLILQRGYGEYTQTQVEVNLSELSGFAFFWGAWNEAAAYDSGDIVFHEDDLHMATGVSPAGTSPSTGAQWRNLTAGGNTSVTTTLFDWTTGTAYTKGAHVKEGESVYIAFLDVPSTVAAPSHAPENATGVPYWAQVSHPQAVVRATEGNFLWESETGPSATQDDGRHWSLGDGGARGAVYVNSRCTIRVGAVDIRNRDNDDPVSNVLTRIRFERINVDDTTREWLTDSAGNYCEIVASPSDGTSKRTVGHVSVGSFPVPAGVWIRPVTITPDSSPGVQAVIQLHLEQISTLNYAPESRLLPFQHSDGQIIRSHAGEWRVVTPDFQTSSNSLYAEIVLATKSHTAPAQPTGVTFDGTTIGGLPPGYVALADASTLGPPSTPTWFLEARTWSSDGGVTWTIQTPWNLSPENDIEYSSDLEQWHYPRVDADRWARIYHTDGTTSQPFALQVTPQNRIFVFGLSNQYFSNTNGVGTSLSISLSPETPLDLRTRNTFGMLALTWYSKSLPPAQTPQFRSVARLMFHPNHILQWIGVNADGTNSSPVPYLIGHVGKDDTQLYWSNTITTSDTVAASHWQHRAAFAIRPFLNSNGTIYAFNLTFLPGGTGGTDVMGNLALEIF